ncbi:MAG TPA: response regulator [Bradyrhizobium sp.]|nr:response regulator [Bradyrhizobium sp.]
MSAVLVVDDDPYSAEELAEAFEDAGIAASWSSDPEEALRRGADPSIRLVITDLRMPGIGGEQLIAQLHAERPDLRFIVITGHAGHADDPFTGGCEILARFGKPVRSPAVVKLALEALA